MSRKKYTEANVPEGIRIQVRYWKGILWTTTCLLLDEGNGNLLGSGQAICSVKDQPVRKIGRAMAIGRALKEYEQGLADL